MSTKRLWLANPNITLLLIAVMGTLVGLSNEAWSSPANPAQTTKSASGQIIKWVDEKGVTHYGDTMPAQYSGRDNSVINNQGMVLKRNQPSKPPAENVDKVDVEQQRRDNALRASYTTEQEIDLTRDRNLKTDEIAVQGLQQNMTTEKARLADNQKTAQGFLTRKKPLPADLTQALQTNQAEITKIEAQIAQRQASMDATRQRFDNDKQRFIELKSGDAKAVLNTTAPAPAIPVAPPAPIKPKTP